MSKDTTQNKINVYTCDKGHKTVTIDREEGTTPFMISCEVEECKTGLARSCMYQTDQGQTPTHEWVKMSDNEMEGMAREVVDKMGEDWKKDIREDLGEEPLTFMLGSMKKHSEMGGLHMRKIKK